ncbi:MAG: glycosyltransferase, partial [Clostridia bacterium]
MNSKDGISVITPTIRSNCQNRIIDNFINQEFDNKELIIIINNDDMQGEILYEYANRYNNIKIFKISQSETLGKCLNFAIRQSTYNIIARFDDDDYYGKYYLKEAYDTFKNNDCDIIGKNKTYYYLEESKELLLRQNAIENDYWKWIAGATFCFKKEILEKIQFQEISRSEDTNFLKDAIENDLKIYSTSRYNYIVYRNGNVDAHTWKIGDDYFEDISEKVKVNIKYEECYPLVLKKIEYSYLNLEDEFEDVYVKCTTNQKRNYHNKIYKESVMDLIKDIPDSNGSRYYKKINKNIAIISDEFMFNYYNESVNLFYINYDNYQNIVEENKIDALLFITCWKGLNNGDWQGIANKPQKKQQIYEIIDKFKSKDIKIIFQSTEDPSDYNSYLDIAKKCDYIFTSDGDKVESYKLECNNKKVYSLEFGVNPLIHNPIGLNMHNKIDSILFAGSWMERFEERCSDMKMIFDGVIESGNKLDIIDRNFNIDEGAYYFPLKYVPCIIPTIDYKNLQKVHKLYDWCINVNSIKNSSTMCSRRIYEAQALGNLIISNYSKAIVKYNPN